MVRQEFTLSMPPSANRLWRMDKRGFMRKSEAAKDYYHEVALIGMAAGIEIIKGEISVTLKIYRARRAGDLDNRIKPLLDALQGVAFMDDKQVIEIHAFRYEDKENPRVEVTIEDLEGITNSQPSQE